MSDFWSGIFLLGTTVVGAFLGIITLFVTLITKKKTRLNTISFVVTFTLLFAWVADRFIVGAFCFPWECVNRNISLETLLLNNDDLPDEWMVKYTFDYAYIPRASASYRERTFHRASASINNDFYEQIYQYRSVRGAAFQYEILKKKLPTSYSIHSTLISPRFELQISYTSEHDFGCIFYDMKVTVCYYLARYDEYVLLLEMFFPGDQISEEVFTEIVKLADEKFLNVLGK